jgi:hypothetical protein
MYYMRARERASHKCMLRELHVENGRPEELVECSATGGYSTAGIFALVFVVVEFI